jgi:hypothetical protein
MEAAVLGKFKREKIQCLRTFCLVCSDHQLLLGRKHGETIFAKSSEISYDPLSWANKE